jgi:hypothetical protein
LQDALIAAEAEKGIRETVNAVKAHTVSNINSGCASDWVSYVEGPAISSLVGNFVLILEITAFASERTRKGLFRADRKDLLALDFDFDAKRRPNIAPLDDGPSHPYVAGKIGSF